jgi:hypothetical protein
LNTGNKDHQHLDVLQDSINSIIETIKTFQIIYQLNVVMVIEDRRLT